MTSSVTIVLTEQQANCLYDEVVGGARMQLVQRDSRYVRSQIHTCREIVTQLEAYGIRGVLAATEGS